MKRSSAAVYLLLYTSVLSCAWCQESNRFPFVSTKIDVVCSKVKGCISDCSQNGFCLDERVRRRGSPSYILDDHVLFLRVHVVRITNASVVAFIQDSFKMPLSVFSAEVFAKSAVRQQQQRFGRDPSVAPPLFDTFDELKAHDKTLSGLRVGDPYCVWQQGSREYHPDIGICYLNEKKGPAVGTLYQSTGSFGFSCSVRRFGPRRFGPGQSVS